MKIVFCTTCKDRAFHLAQTLPKNLENNPRSTFVVLDYGTTDNLLEILEPLQCDRLKVYSFQTDGPFHMAHAKNMAHRCGMLEGADFLVNLDADNYLHAGFEDFIDANVRDDTVLVPPKVRGWGRKFRGVSGRIGVTVNAFLKAGGYDEKFATWSPDDKDFNARVQHLGYRPVEIEREHLEAIFHGDGIRFKEYPDAKLLQMDEESFEVVESPIANYGRFGCGTVLQRETGRLIELGPLPTRIFGIGMHKTATSSLDKALRLLGFDSLHWPSGEWARDVWDEMRFKGRSPVLERCYAASDLPITLLYKELDRAYPGSKFILTVRDEVDWLRSVRDHWSPRNPFRWEWDVYPISNRLHKALYGRIDFDTDTFLARYRSHNAEVKDYFRDTPEQLLVMEEHDWPALCQFLGKPVPSRPYPKEFVTQRGS